MAMGMSMKTKYSVGTVIVAADGSGDFTDIQDAIDSLPSTGGVVYVKEGTYNITSDIEINGKDNVSLFGAGSATIISTTSSIGIFVSDSKGSYIKDLSIVGSSTTYGIYLVDVDASTFRRISISSVSNGIYLAYDGDGCNDCQISECSISASTNGIWNGYGEGIIISNNNISNSTYGIQSYYSGLNGVMFANIITNVSHGIKCYISSDLISSNKIETSVSGISVTLLYGGPCVSNICNNIIEFTSDFADNGIKVSANYGTYDINICGNTIYAEDLALTSFIKLIDVSNFVVSNNVCRGLAEAGAWIDSCNTGVISSNSFEEGQYDAFWLLDSSGVSVSSNSVTGYWDYGVRLENSGKCSITGNILNLTGITTKDIKLDSSSNYNSVVSNIAKTTGITDSGTGNIVASNVV